MKQLLYSVFILSFCFSGSILSQNPEWKNYTNGDDINAIEMEGNFVWVGTDGGLVKINKISGEKEFFNKANSGLPSNRVNCIAIDNFGNKWIGAGGLVKFDGTNWEVYNTSNSGLPYNFINCIAIDEIGNKWIGTWDGGLVKFDDTSWEVYDLSNSGLQSNLIKDIVLDETGNIWIGTYPYRKGYGVEEIYTGGGLVKFDGTNWEVYNTSNSGFPSNGINCISIDESGNKWIGTYDAGLVKFDGTNWEVYNTSNSDLPSNGINCISIDESGNKWIGTYDAGLVKFDGTNWEVYNTSNSDLPSNWINHISIDETRNKWIGMITNRGGETGDGGLVKFDDTNWEVYNTSNSGLPSNRVNCIAIEGNGNNWIGLDDGGLVKFDGTNWEVYNTSNSGLPSNRVICIAIDEIGNKWMGTWEGLVKFDGTSWEVYNSLNSDLPSNWISCIAIDESDNKWIGTGRCGFGCQGEGIGKLDADNTTWTIYDTLNSGLPSNVVNCIAIDGKDNKWIGPWGGGLVKFDGTDWTIYGESNSGFPIYGINCITIDKNGNKWIGTGGCSFGCWGEGIGKLDADNTTWTIYDTLNSGLSSNITVGISIDQTGNKWIGTRRAYSSDYESFSGGLAKFDDAVWTVYDEGLPSDDIICITIDKNGNKWIGTPVGLAVFNEGGVVSVEENKSEIEQIPSRYVLSQNYPNPFNPSTTIKYSIPKQSNVTLKIFDLMGSEVATLVKKEQPQGNYEIDFDGKDLTSGIYFFRLQVYAPGRAGDFVETRKMILLK